MIYILILVLFSIISFFDYIKTNKIAKSILTLIGGSIFLFFSAFRYKTGMDWHTYLNEYNNLEIINRSYTSLGYLELEKIGNSLAIDYFIFQAIISIFAGVIILRFYEKNSKYTWTAITLYYSLFYLTYNMAVQKQMLAMSFCMLAFDCWDKSKKKSYIYLGIAVIFHFSSIIMVIVGIINFCTLKIQKKFKYSTKINIVFISLLILMNVNLIENVLDIILKLDLPVISQKIGAYRSIDYYSKEVKPSLILWIYLFGELFLGYIIFRKRYPRDKKEKNIYKFTIGYFFIKILSLKMYILYRFISYFGIFYCIFLANFLDIIKPKKIIFIIQIILYLYLSASFLSVMLTKEERRHKMYNPYYNIFNRIESEERLKAELGI